jgi:HSP20 family protein
MAIVRYSTYPLTNLQQQMNRVFEQFDKDLLGQSDDLGGGMFRPAVDVKEDADGYTVQVEVPGVAQENLNIMMQDNTLLIKGHKEQKQQTGDAQFRRVERSYGSFARSLQLPRNVDGSKVSANLHDGVLDIRLPKLEESKPRQINIGVTTNAPQGE